MRKKTSWKLGLGLGCLTLAVGLAYLGLHLAATPERTDIKVQALGGSFDSGTTTGVNASSAGSLKTASTLQYESPETATNQPKTNAISLQWDQQGGAHVDETADASQAEPVTAQVRTYDGNRWTDWTTLNGAEDKKDGIAETSHSAIVLTKDAAKLQYRFALSSASAEPIEISNPRVVAIDATVGPDPTEQPGGLAKWLNVKTAKAATPGPRVYSRGEWGCPEATSSPRWPAEYYTLNRVMVHHTAATNAGYGGAGAVRAIWYQHANTNNWGDIGYNYLVDQGGNIYQGRYMDQQYADSTKQVPEGGHTFGYNRESIGIAALGNFGAEGSSGAMNESIAHIAGFKMAVRNLQPWSTYTDVQGRAQYRLGGHRNYTSTECPGGNMYNLLGSLRSRAADFVSAYGLLRQFDYSFQGEGVNGVPGGTVALRNNQTATFYLDLKNEGEDGWQKSGPNQVRLGTDNPRDRGSGFASGWAAPNRTGTYAGKVVNGTLDASDTLITTGETARFQFTVRNPNLNGSYLEYFQPIVEGYAWFPRNIGINWTINAERDTYQGQWLDQKYGVPTTPNTDATLTLTVKNTGNMPWSNTGGTDTVTLGTDRPMNRVSQLQHSSWSSSSRVGAFTGKAQLDGSGQPVKSNGNVVYDNTATTIQPGEAAHWVFQVRTPSQSVNAQEFFRPLIEGKTWLNDLGIWWPVNVDAGYRAQFAGQSAAPTITKSVNPVGSMYFDYTNTGGATWIKDGAHPVRLGTDKPRDRGSGFATFGLSGGSDPALPANAQNWLSTSRVNSFSGKVSGGTLDTSATAILPGETARFVIALDARNIPAGTYPEYFSPVAEGSAWLFFGTWLPITVRENPTIGAAGDVACDPADANYGGGNGTVGGCHMKGTANLLTALNPNRILALGDLQYEDGALAKFQQSYESNWGQHKSKTDPVPGNHEYVTAAAGGYFSYFGAAAGNPATGYYSKDLGQWHLVALNSNCAEVGGCGAGSVQEQWLRADLAATTKPCVLAYWHHPRFSSGQHGDDAATGAFWQALRDANADVILNGHDHNYERFHRQNPDATADAAGLREFVVGTGGKNLRSYGTIRANSAVRHNSAHGVLQLTLQPTQYDWAFVTEAGATLDAGSTACH